MYYGQMGCGAELALAGLSAPPRRTIRPRIARATGANSRGLTWGPVPCAGCVKVVLDGKPGWKPPVGNVFLDVPVTPGPGVVPERPGPGAQPRPIDVPKPKPAGPRPVTPQDQMGIDLAKVVVETTKNSFAFDAAIKKLEKAFPGSSVDDVLGYITNGEIDLYAGSYGVFDQASPDQKLAIKEFGLAANKLSNQTVSGLVSFGMKYGSGAMSGGGGGGAGLSQEVKDLIQLAGTNIRSAVSNNFDSRGGSSANIRSALQIQQVMMRTGQLIKSLLGKALAESINSKVSTAKEVNNAISQLAAAPAGIVGGKVAALLDNLSYSNWSVETQTAFGKIGLSVGADVTANQVKVTLGLSTWADINAKYDQERQQRRAQKTRDKAAQNKVFDKAILAQNIANAQQWPGNSGQETQFAAGTVNYVPFDAAGQMQQQQGNTSQQANSWQNWVNQTQAIYETNREQAIPGGGGNGARILEQIDDLFNRQVQVPVRDAAGNVDIPVFYNGPIPPLSSSPSPTFSLQGLGDLRSTPNVVLLVAAVFCLWKAFK